MDRKKSDFFRRQTKTQPNKNRKTLSDKNGQLEPKNLCILQQKRS